ncbi:hypothetical protein [Variovorax sp. LjRoot178]|uniref:hypothetical protein n=1 Tax=Variovorax sp. LjRoot178 TaxID=3342277 RepID=UPI003ECFFA6B
MKLPNERTMAACASSLALAALRVASNWAPIDTSVVRADLELKPSDISSFQHQKP